MRKTALETFPEQFANISNEELSKQAQDFIDENAPDYFWERGASSSGKYHPAVCNGPGGLIRHTKLVCMTAMALLEASDFGPDVKDQYIVASLLHDMYKDGDPLRKGTNYKMHGKHVSERIVSEIFGGDETKAFTSKVWSPIIAMVGCHMGKWTEEKMYRPANLPDGFAHKKHCIMFSTADYMASKKWDMWFKSLSALS